MRLLPLLLLGLCPLLAPNVAAQLSPDAKEDAREERLKLMRAADQLDALQNQSEQTGTKLASLEETVTKLEKENGQLRSKLSKLEDQLSALQQAQAEQQKTILAEIKKLLKDQKPSSAPTAAQPSTDSNTSSVPVGDSEQWYMHVVEKGQTLSAIAKAFREQGVDVTVEDIRKANKIKKDNLIQVGQTLYIPKS